MTAAMERCGTARCAIATMGSLAEEYGFTGETRGASETVTIIDKQDAWVFEISGDGSGKGALWVAKRVPDGKVVVIEEVEEPEYFKDKRKQISIFMSPVNVHVNRAPVSGKVLYYKYFKGKYLVAWHPKSSTENERTTVVMEEGGKQILFRQIAGALARRIVCYAKPGMEIARGGEYGFIKFGSRIDIYLPLDAEVLVQLEQKTVGGETVIAKW